MAVLGGNGAEAGPILKWSHHTERAAFAHLSWDTEGRNAADRNLLLSSRIQIPDEESRLEAKINGSWHPLTERPTVEGQAGQWVRYTVPVNVLPEAPFQVIWEIASEPGAALTQTFRVVGSGAGVVEALRLRLALDAGVTPTAIVPSVWNATNDATFQLPAVVNAADFGQMYLSSSTSVLGHLKGNRFTPDGGSDGRVYVSLDMAPPTTGSHTLRLAPVYLPRPSLVSSERLWTLARRAWWNVLQPSASWVRPVSPALVYPTGILSNNVVAVPCALALHFYADSAFWTPEVAPGISAAAQVRRTVEWWLGRQLDGGQVPGCDLVTAPMNLMDGNPGVLIAAWDYVEATGDVGWLKQHIAALESVSRYLEDRVDFHDGLVTCLNSGVYGDVRNQGCDWFDIINSGHKNAYLNAFVYRAWRGMATLEARLGNTQAQARYTALADRLKKNYFRVFYNPETQWLGWWRDDAGRLGRLHDYHSIVVNGLAIEYGLVPPDTGRQILARLRARIAEAKFSRFDLGVPHVLTPIRRGDYVQVPVPDPRVYGSPQTEEGWDTFGLYENGGITGGQVLHFLAAHYVVGDPEPADEILRAMLQRMFVGGFQNGAPRGPLKGIDWTTWNGAPSGYEGMLTDVYRLPQAVLLREKPARARFYAHLYPQGDMPPGADAPPDIVDPPPPLCVPEKPYDGNGVTAAWERADGQIMITSGNRFWVLSLGATATTPPSWTDSGFLSNLPDWSTAPTVDGVRPWDCGGVTSVSRDSEDGALAIISRDRLWQLKDNGSWGVCDTLPRLWSDAPSSPAGLPWEYYGITAAWTSLDGGVRTYVSRDRYWQRRRTETSWVWSSQYLFYYPEWSAAFPPPLANYRLWEGPDGVTAAFRGPDGRMWLISRDKYWVFDTTTSPPTWPSHGFLRDIWSNAPAVCGPTPVGAIPPGEPVCALH